MIEGILETALYAEDLDAAEAFYGGILALRRFSEPATGMSSFAAAPVSFWCSTRPKP
jgi:catechol 2,3-dioxygenase-like lactoylglutathione lyase family enzyme